MKMFFLSFQFSLRHLVSFVFSASISIEVHCGILIDFNTQTMLLSVWNITPNGQSEKLSPPLNYPHHLRCGMKSEKFRAQMRKFEILHLRLFYRMGKIVSFNCNCENLLSTGSVFSSSRLCKRNKEGMSNLMPSHTQHTLTIVCQTNL